MPHQTDDTAGVNDDILAGKVRQNGLRHIKITEDVGFECAAKLLLAPGRRQGAVPQVVGEVEVGIVNPDRAAQSQRDEADLLPRMLSRRLPILLCCAASLPFSARAMGPRTFDTALSTPLPP